MMKLEKLYNFFFHPFAKEHSPETKAISAITVIALSILSMGGFLIAFGIVQYLDRKVSLQNPKDNKISELMKPLIQPENAKPHQPQIKLSPESQKKILNIKTKNIEQVHLFEKWAKEDDWKRFSPAYSHYDWWAFPISVSSSSYGDTYAVNKDEIEVLKADPEFMQGYRQGVNLVVLSWGWDLKKNGRLLGDERKSGQQWTGYGVRLGKMADSLKLFGEMELYKSLQHFFDVVCIPQANKYPLEKWVYTNLGR